MTELPRLFVPELNFISRLVLLLALAGSLTGCGSGGSSGGMSAPTAPSGTTQVTVVMSSTANDQVIEYNVNLLGVTLTNQAGRSVTLPVTALGSEFIHANGRADPLFVANVPQDVYTSATVQAGFAEFGCIASVSGVLQPNLYTSANAPTTVIVPAPITVAGASMGLALNLVASDSAFYSTCPTGSSLVAASIAPTFTLTPFALSAQQSNAQYSKVVSLDGQAFSVDTVANTFLLDLQGPSRGISVRADAGIAWQGVANLASLADGMFVDLDGAIQPDGSVVATRVAVLDPMAVNVERGPLITFESPSIVAMYPWLGQGKDQRVVLSLFNIGSATYRISGHFTNLQALPFTPSFNATNMVPGQEVYISSPAFSFSPTNLYRAANTITLMPQSIDGTVLTSGTNGAFDTYVVFLAGYNLFPAAQGNATTPLNDPSAMVVYVDQNTRLFQSAPIAMGSTLRFYGLVFNDNGTLRMDCAQVSDGVSQ